MNEPLVPFLLIAGGIGLGGVYFGGLYVTLRMLPNICFPAFFCIASFACRTVLAAIVIAFTAYNGSAFDVFCVLAGFILARIILVKWLRPEILFRWKKAGDGTHP